MAIPTVTDRNVQYPNRIQLTEVTTDVYDVTAVPGSIIAAGTAVNKALLDQYAVETQTTGASAKTTPVDADLVPIADSAAANMLKKLTFANLAAYVLETTKVGAFIAALTAKTTPVDADYVALMDSAASNVAKKLSWANIKTTLKTYLNAETSITGTHLMVNRATGTGVQAIANNTGTTIGFDTVVKDEGSSGAFTASATEAYFTVPVSGYYRFSGKIMFDATNTWAQGTEHVSVWLVVASGSGNILPGTNTVYYSGAATTNFYFSVPFSMEAYLTATSQIKVCVTQVSGGSLNLYASSGQNFLNIHRIA